MDAVATAKRPNKHKNKNNPKKIKSIFLKSGNEKYVSNLSNIVLRKNQKVHETCPLYPYNLRTYQYLHMMEKEEPHHL